MRTPLYTIFVIFLAGCAGRSPELVQLVQPTDRYADCEQITLEIKANNETMTQLAKDQGWKAAQNITAGVVGLAIPILWFGMDFQGTAGKEAKALSQRNEYLASLAKKRCS